MGRKRNEELPAESPPEGEQSEVPATKPVLYDSLIEALAASDDGRIYRLRRRGAQDMFAVAPSATAALAMLAETRLEAAAKPVSQKEKYQAAREALRKQGGQQ